MFKTILVPTDGSALSDKAIDAAIEFAQFNNSKIIGFSVAEPYPFTSLAETDTVMDSAAAYEEKMRQIAHLHVHKIANAALAANVACDTFIAQSFNPCEEILRASKKFGCDIIFMASHGRKGLNRLFLGSETQKVLTHSNLPVLIFR